VQAIDDKIYTLEQYIQIDESGYIKHEFINGQLYEISGASDLHNEICYNLTHLLKTGLKGKEYKVYMESVKVKILSEDYYSYPDVFVTGNR
jgi:Uma2 family endonuclease